MNNKNLEQKLKSIVSHSILELHILPTEKCNFRCTYCYEDFNIGKMHNNVIVGIKNLLRKRIKELKQLRISWFGGEPLAATPIVLEISQYAKKLAIEHNCKYFFSITTNGYLLNQKKLKSIIDAGITSFQISLDGTEEYHNITRLRADGAGTFTKIWNNLIEMSKTKYDFNVTLRIHVTPKNFANIIKLLDSIDITFKNDTRFKIFIKAIENLGGPNANKFATLCKKSKEQIVSSLNEIISNRQTHAIKYINSQEICYASAQNSWVIRANGTLAKCTVMLDNDLNKIGFIKPNGNLIIEQNKIQLWLRGLKTQDSKTMSCPAYKLPKLNNIPIKTI